MMFGPRTFAVTLIIAFTVFAVQSCKLDAARDRATELQGQLAAAHAAIKDADDAAKAKELEFNKKLIGAQNDAQKREIELRNVAAAARNESVGLRKAADNLRDQLAGASAAAAIDRAAAIADVLAACGREHQELAERCDRHVSDIRTLIQSWPAN